VEVFFGLLPEKCPVHQRGRLGPPHGRVFVATASGCTAV